MPGSLTLNFEISLNLNITGTKNHQFVAFRLSINQGENPKKAFETLEIKSFFPPKPPWNLSSFALVLPPPLFSFPPTTPQNIYLGLHDITMKAW